MKSRYVKSNESVHWNTHRCRPHEQLAVLIRSTIKVYLLGLNSNTLVVFTGNQVGTNCSILRWLTTVLIVSPYLGSMLWIDQSSCNTNLRLPYATHLAGACTWLTSNFPEIALIPCPRTIVVVLISLPFGRPIQLVVMFLLKMGRIAWIPASPTIAANPISCSP